MAKRALITGVTGQDGSYLTELLISKGYEVHGLYRRHLGEQFNNLSEVIDNPNLTLIEGELSDPIFVNNLISNNAYDEIYNLAAQSHVQYSFNSPAHTTTINSNAVLTLLEAIKLLSPSTRLYHASTSEMFGGHGNHPQSEDTPFDPRSPYAVAKVYSHNMVSLYRQAYGLYAVSGILFNHESERRGEDFVTRKITKALARIKLGLQDKLTLGNLEAMRDWGHAKDYVYGMWLMLQQEEPKDYVLATGETHTVREFLEEACKLIDLDYNDFLEIDPKFIRPLEVDLLLGDPTKANKELGWKPKITFKKLVNLMLANDLMLEARKL